ncbi:MAG: heme biosynthesis HemY N-terminal domain-containing protein [Alphaproteobacteria bacterium]|nr:heme biosynthesis HemY N-terminal domain-containing protein [Alphaproteobacteria bacterium]
MIRGLILFIKVGLIVAAAVYLSKYPGQVSIDWQGWRIDMSLALLALTVLVVTVVVVVVLRAWFGAVHAPGKFMTARRGARRDRGYHALTQGLAAVAAGDAAEAKKLARKADGLLKDPPLTRLLAAQAAQLDGDDQAAERYFEAMLEDKDTAILALRGLMMRALDAGDSAEARRLAEQAHRERPGAAWAADHLIEAMRADGDFDGALAVLTTAARHKAYPAASVKKRRADLILGKARALQRQESFAKALSLTQEAKKLDPANPNAVTMAARLLYRDGKPGKAARVIEDAWRVSPDPALASAYRDVAPDRTDLLAQVKRFERLLAFNPDHEESHLALAEAALDANLWGEARTHIGKVMAETGEDQAAPRVCRLMARLEEQEHGDVEKARVWLMRASENAA